MPKDNHPNKATKPATKQKHNIKICFLGSVKLIDTFKLIHHYENKCRYVHKQNIKTQSFRNHEDKEDQPTCECNNGRHPRSFYSKKILVIESLWNRRHTKFEVL